MEHATQVFAALTLLVIGLSHLLQPRAWLAHYQSLSAQGTTGAFTEGFQALTFGGIVVGFHNVWTGPGILLTVIGWGQVLRGVSRFLAPEFGVRVMSRGSAGRPWTFQVGGVFALLLSGYLWWLRFRG